MVEKVEAEITFEEKKALQSLKRISEATESTARKIQKSFGRADKGVKKIETSVLDLAKGFVAGSIGVNIMSGSIEILRNFSRDLVVEFIDLEKALVGVAKTTNLTGDDLETLDKTIRGLTTILPVSATELLGLAQAAGQLGVKGVDNLTKFAEVMAKLNVATDIAGEEGARAIVRILTITGDGVENIDRFGAAVVDLGNNFAATESEIVAVAVRVARSTVQFQLGATNVLGIATALKALGVQAQEGGSAVGRAFKEIQKSINEGGERMEILTELTGLTGEQLKETFEKDATRVFSLFVKGLGKIEKSKVTQTLEQMGLKGLRVSSVLATLATRSELVSDALDRSNTAFKDNTALNKEAEQAFDTLGSQLTITGNLISKIAQEAFQPLGERIKSATKLLNKFLILINKPFGIDLSEIALELAESIITTDDLTRKLDELNKKLAETKEEFIKGKIPVEEGSKEIARLEKFIASLQTRLEKGTVPLLIRVGRPPDAEIDNIFSGVLGQLEAKAAEQEIEIPFRIGSPEPGDDEDLVKKAEILTDIERKLQADIQAIRLEADLFEEERQLRLSEVSGEATTVDLERLKEIEKTKITIKADAELKKADLIKKSKQKELTIEKISAKTKLDIAKKLAKDEEDVARQKQAFEQLTAQQSINLATNTGNFINAVQGEQTKAGFVLAKVAAVAGVLVADGIARAQATAASAGAAAASGAAAPAVFALTLAQMQALITLNTTLSLGTIAATSIRGFQGGGIIPGTPITSGRDTAIFAGSPGEVILNRAQQNVIAGDLPSNELLASIDSKLSVLIAKDTSVQIDGREIARTIQLEQESGFDISA